MLQHSWNPTSKMIPAGEWGSRHCIMSFALVWRTVLRQIHWLHELILRLAMDLVARLKKLWAFFFWLLVWLGEVSSLIIRMVTYVEWFILDFWHCLIQKCSTRVTIANTRLVLRLFLPQNLCWIYVEEIECVCYRLMKLVMHTLSLLWWQIQTGLVER